MSLLLSNYQPIKRELNSFYEAFHDLSFKSDEISIAVGYISESSLSYVFDLVYSNKIRRLNLIIGMHYFERFTYLQYEAAIALNELLRKKDKGGVFLVNKFPYHGKIYQFVKATKTFSSIIGSSNLDNIIPKKAIRQYEADIFIEDKNTLSEISSFISELKEKASEPLHLIPVTDFRKNENLFEGIDGINKISLQELQDAKLKKLLDQEIDLPLKSYEDAPKSNLHTHLGKGRKKKPRSWYEVELIMPKNICQNPKYPGQKLSKGEEFLAITDDGYKFGCLISGDYGKNFRSCGDLKLLGLWIKGRLEERGAVHSGDNITSKALLKYGRDNITLTPLSDGKWFMDFSV